MAVGIACASTGNPDALNLLFPLLNDRTDFVRQSAYIGNHSSFILLFYSCTHCAIPVQFS